MAVLGEYRFRMKLHPLHRQRFMPHTHDFTILRPCGDGEHFGVRRLFNRQRVVAIDRELRRQIGEHTFLRGLDNAGFAVHQLLRANDVAAECRTYGLVTEAYPEDRQLAGKVLNCRD